MVLDEPVSALDVSIRAQIMNLLKDIQTEYGLSYLMIAHNLATVRYMSHAVAIMYLGEVVEYARSDELFENPLHPYTKALMSAALPTHPDDVTRGDRVVRRDAVAAQSAAAVVTSTRAAPPRWTSVAKWPPR